jgi:hypothetical protein
MAPIDTMPRWALMWSLAVAIYVLLKTVSWQQRQVVAAPWWRHVAYLFAWPGMDADVFLDVRRQGLSPTVTEWLFAVAKLALGVVLLSVVVPGMKSAPPLVVGWLAMIGLVFVLHFGLFHLLSCLWRCCGVDAVPIMQWPILSQSVAEFWGRRWNLAFRDLTHKFLFRPLSPRLGTTGAMFAGFVLSGLVHDLVITVPAGAGYGGPTGFFVVQGLAMMIERSPLGRRVGLGRGGRGRCFTALVLIAPVGWLFPEAFVCGVMLPFVEWCLTFGLGMQG